MCRGRPRCRRRVESVPDITYFKPRGIPLDELEIINLTVEEYEAVRLVDFEGLEQEQAAARMGVSRRAFWDDIQNARKKIADALVNGKAIEIKGGDFVVEVKRKFKCSDCQNEWDDTCEMGRPQKCPECESTNIHRHPEDKCCQRDLRMGGGKCQRGRVKTGQVIK